MQKFENFYLQTKDDLSWETLDESQNLDNLVARLEEKNTSLSGLKIRIIGAAFDEDNNSWKYEQLFFHDLSITQNGKRPEVEPLETSDNDGLKRKKEELSVKNSNLLNGKPGSEVSDSRFLYVILIIGGLITAIAFGVRQGFGIFLTPISLEFGFGREIFALAIALQNLVMGVAQPFVGAFADKFGAFRTIVFGTLLYSCGLFLMAFSTTSDMFYLSAGVLAGVGLAG